MYLGTGTCTMVHVEIFFYGGILLSLYLLSVAMGLRSHLFQTFITLNVHYAIPCYFTIQIDFYTRCMITSGLLRSRRKDVANAS